jgi:hypothetical protein
MKGYVTKTPEAKALRRVVKKYGTLNIKDDTIEGTIQITHYRQYDFQEEVDVTFVGKIYVKYGGYLIWFDHQLYTKDFESISKIKLDRVLRKLFFSHLQFHLLIFGVRLNYISEIKNVKWIG